MVVSEAAPILENLVDTLNQVFQAQIPEDPKYCLLGILDSLQVEEPNRQAVARALFQARLATLRRWKSTEPPTLQEWIALNG